MFCLSGELTSIDLSNFNTEKVTDMFFMFADCHSLTNLDLSNFNTENVTNMRGMFGGCEKLTRLDISNFSTEKVTDMSYMFQWCTNMTNLNLSHFDMSGVSNKQDMCSALSTESGACTITCPTAVRTALEHGTDLPTSGVVFTWVTP
jgi:surface protein